MATVAEEIQEAVAHLPPSDQQRVLTYVRELAHSAPMSHTPLPPGTPGSAIADLRVSPEGGEIMEKALEDGERIDPDEWE